MNEKRNRTKVWKSEKKKKKMNDIICPLFSKLYKDFGCLHDSCKYWQDECNYEEIRKVVYQKLAAERLKQAGDDEESNKIKSI